MTERKNKSMEETDCRDAHCPRHSALRIRGRIFTGTVTESKAQKTATVEWERRYYLPKYERYEKRKTRMKTHNPDCINAKKGDIVKIMECRPISKTKHFVITEITGKNIAYMEKEHLMQESKFRQQKKIAAEEAEKTESTE